MSIKTYRMELKNYNIEVFIASSNKKAIKEASKFEFKNEWWKANTSNKKIIKHVRDIK